MTIYPPSIVIPVYAVLTGVGILLTCLRLWVRIHHASSSASLGADDILIVAGVVVTTACAAIQFYNAVDGTGGEAISGADADARALVAHRINYAMIVIEKAAFGAIKLSLLFFYRRIFGVRPSFRRVNHTLITFIILWTAAFILADLLICGKDVTLQLALDQTKALHGCGDKGILLIAFAASSILTDVLVLGLPLLYVRQLKMAPKKKLAAAFVFFLGTVSTLAGILRLIFLCVAYPLGRFKFGYVAPPDEKEPFVLSVFNPTFWVMVEMCLGVWAANLLPLWPLLRGLKAYLKSGSMWKKLSSSASVGTQSAAKETPSKRRWPQERAHPSYGSQSFDSLEMYPDQSHDR